MPQYTVMLVCEIYYGMSGLKKIPAVGTEISFFDEGIQRRGWIVSAESQEVGVYPLSGEETESRCWPVAEAEITQAQQALEGWEGLRLEGDHTQEPIEVRLSTIFVNGLREDAQRAGISIEDLVLDYLRVGLDQLNG